ncbi:hypothetical protein [Flavobacterium sp.]|uniref:helix-turn-helix transcriptional regulator n=1 Tax=Flavobacterium sp. TaxID=239 RepID=UPI00286C5B8D|nr:hypothetical protein [Flavobacterium sp.]
MKKYFCYILLLCYGLIFANPQDNILLQKGWNALVKDQENEAFSYFWQAFEKAKKENNTEDKAESLLYLGICSFGASSEKGLRYATQSLSEYKKLSSSHPELAKNGRSRCLQLISTIYSRQKKYTEAIALSKNVVADLEGTNDKEGTLGLAYTSLGTLYEIQKQNDSSAYFFKHAVAEFERAKNIAYLPNAYIKMGDLAKKKNGKNISYNYYTKALQLSNTSENKQAQVSCLVALGKWELAFNNDEAQAEIHFQKAKQISSGLSDKVFEIKSIQALIELKKKQKKYLEVSQLQDAQIKIKDHYYSLEREQIAKNLEVQFEVAEKDRKLELISKEKEVSRLTNSLLFSLVMLLVIVFSFWYFFLKRINKRDKQLLKTKEELFAVLEEQKKLKEQQFENDIEHKESQLSAITLQMLQKNELLEEIKSIIHKKEDTTEKQLSKVINSHFTKDNNWNDFDKYFESVNKNFYNKLKQKYPDISSNDLKICALIKLNLSIKEMASILNISPDSVKTARYRLRKKLQLTTEDNLTEFILSV